MDCEAQLAGKLGRECWGWSVWGKCLGVNCLVVEMLRRNCRGEGNVQREKCMITIYKSLCAAVTICAILDTQTNSF